MNLDFDTLNALALRPFKGPRELVKKLQVLRENFTKKREEISEYLDSEELVSAYSCFYLPTNFPKLAHSLDLLPIEMVTQMAKSIFIDVGCGPGTFLLGLLDYTNKNNIPLTGEMWGVEKSQIMIRQARKILKELAGSAVKYSIMEPSILKDSLKRVQDQPKILLFGNSFNEMDITQAKKYIDLINPTHILLIEPGTPLVFQKLQEIIPFLKANNFTNIYPCPQGADSCPIANSSSDWCHQIIDVKHHQSIESISQMAQLDRKKLPLIFHAYSLEQPVFNEDIQDQEIINSRIIQCLKETKYSYNFRVCISGPTISTIEIFKKPLSKIQANEIRYKRSGQTISFKIEKELNDGRIRVTL